MTILWAGTEAEAFALPGGGIGGTAGASSNVDLDFSRSYYQLEGAASRCNREDFGAIPEAWFHYRWGGAVTGSETSARELVVFRTSSGQGILRLYQTGSAPNKYFQYWSGSAWVDIGAALTITTSNGRTLDVGCKIDSTVGRFVLFVDGIAVRELTGNTDFFSAGVDYVTIQYWGNTNERRVSECIISTTSTVGMRLATISATANGDEVDWTGIFSDVNAALINDSTMISSGTSGEEECFAMSDLSTPASLLQPLAVIVSSRAKNSPTGPQNLQSLVRTGGSNFTSSNFPGLSTSFENGFQTVWELNPNTSALWTPAEVNALQVGAKSDT